MDVTKPYRFLRFGAMDVTKPYRFLRFGAMDVTKPYRFIGFGAMEVTKPYRFIGFGTASPSEAAADRSNAAQLLCTRRPIVKQRQKTNNRFNKILIGFNRF